MTLHEAIVQVLCENMHEMTTQEIADEINQRRLYTKKDSTEVTAFQIHGRTRNYPQLFTRRGSWVGLVEWDSKPKMALSRTFENSSIKTKTSEVILIQDDMTTVSSLGNVGFENIGTIQQLFSFGLPSLPQLNCCGLYAISIPKNYNVVFLSPEDSSVKKNVGSTDTQILLKFAETKNLNHKNLYMYPSANLKNFPKMFFPLN